jgi:hypothetical protein
VYGTRCNSADARVSRQICDIGGELALSHNRFAGVISAVKLKGIFGNINA